MRNGSGFVFGKRIRIHKVIQIQLRIHNTAIFFRNLRTLNPTNSMARAGTVWPCFPCCPTKVRLKLYVDLVIVLEDFFQVKSGRNSHVNLNFSLYCGSRSVRGSELFFRIRPLVFIENWQDEPVVARPWAAHLPCCKYPTEPTLNPPPPPRKQD